MRLLGAKCVGVESGTKTLKDAVNEALRDWVTNVETTIIIGRRWPASLPNDGT